MNRRRIVEEELLMSRPPPQEDDNAEVIEEDSPVRRPSRGESKRASGAPQETLPSQKEAEKLMDTYLAGFTTFSDDGDEGDEGA
jgi:hypothetical protein